MAEKERLYVYIKKENHEERILHSKNLNKIIQSLIDEEKADRLVADPIIYYVEAKLQRNYEDEEKTLKKLDSKQVFKLMYKFLKRSLKSDDDTEPLISEEEEENIFDV